MASRGQLAKRALVRVLLALAAVYGLVVNVSRDSADDAVKAAYRRVVRRAHPDKGGAVADAQRLQAAKEAWDTALGAKRARAPPQGEPGGSADPEEAGEGTTELADPEEARRPYRIHSTGVPGGGRGRGATEREGDTEEVVDKKGAASRT